MGARCDVSLAPALGRSKLAGMGIFPKPIRNKIRLILLLSRHQNGGMWSRLAGGDALMQHS